jgi:hypothetical protein
MRRATLALLALATGLVAGTPERGDPAARLSTSDNALEYWDFMARFDDGHRLFARVLVTNEGPGDRTAVAVGHLIRPNAETVEFRNGRLDGNWSIEPDGRKLRIGSSELDLHAPFRTLAHDNNRRGIDIRVRFESRSPGRRCAGERADYRVDLLDLAVPVEGTIQLAGMAAPLSIHGRGTITHTWMDRSEPDLVLRRIDFTSVDSGDAVYLLDVLAPGGEKTHWLVIERAGRIFYEASDVGVDVDTRPGSPARGYPVPARLRIRGAAVSGSIALDRTLLEHDPLGDLPQPFRFLLSFAMRPRRVWTEAPFTLQLDATPDRPALELAGHGIASLTYLNPLSSTTK